MHNTHYLAGAIIGLIAPAALVQPLAIAQTPPEIAEQAQQFVVQINNNSNGEYPVGSGFIIGRSGNTYQVLTNKHVLTPLGITHIAQTHDGQTYQLTNVEYFQGADLAVATFTSSRSYTVASLGQSSQLAIAQEIHIAGYPAPLSLNQPREYRFLPNSNINGFVDHQNIEDGYSIYFTADAFPGMSGSPLLNEKGEVVGIYGRAVGPNSLGIPIDLAKQLAPQQSIAKVSGQSERITATEQTVGSRQSQVKFLNGTWEGTYICRQGLTNLKLVITAKSSNDIDAVFNFSAHPSNPSVPSGSFRMNGSYTASNSQNIPALLNLKGTSWIQRPSGWGTVDLRGNVFISEGKINGDVITPGCSRFELTWVSSQKLN